MMPIKTKFYKVDFISQDELLYSEIVKGTYDSETRQIKGDVVYVLYTKPGKTRTAGEDTYNVWLSDNSTIKEVSQQEYPEYFL